MNALHDGWFTESSPDCSVHGSNGDVTVKEADHENGQTVVHGWPGQAFSLEVKEILYHKKSDYQDILVFESKSYGKVLALDGVIQCTERDEFTYQEMMAHPAMCLHENPKSVAIIGGGDGGVLREVLKHSCVETVVLCEIDKDVIDVSKKYLPKMACSFEDPRATVFVGCGFEYLKNHPNSFDVIITDSSDPIGPAANLFEECYYNLLKLALTEKGVLCSQAESLFLHFPLIQEMYKFCKALFPSVAYACGYVPTYPGGSIGYLLCSKNEAINLRQPLRLLSEEEMEKMDLKYFNPEIHRAAFVLPSFAQKALSA